MKSKKANSLPQTFAVPYYRNDVEYFANIQLTAEEKIFEFDQSRPPKNVDVLKFVLSRSRILK